MPAASIKVSRRRDRSKVVVLVRLDGIPSHGVELDAAGAERVLHQIAAAREATDPPVPAEPDTVRAVIGPAWDARAQPGGVAGVLLAFRHSGLGWLGFHLPPAEALALGRLLTRLAQSGTEPPSLPPAHGPLH